jgi:hypothetical protein
MVVRWFSIREKCVLGRCLLSWFEECYDAHAVRDASSEATSCLGFEDVSQQVPLCCCFQGAFFRYGGFSK